MFVELLEKLAGSRLREGISVVPDNPDGTFWNILHQDRLSSQPSRVVGQIGLDDYGQVHQSFIAPEFQGTGAARKAYGEVARRMPGGALYSDNLQTPGSFSTWKGMFKQHISDSVAGKQNSFAVLPTSAGYPYTGSFYSAPSGLPNWQGQMPQKAIIPTQETAGFNTTLHRNRIARNGATDPSRMEQYMATSRVPQPGVRSLSNWEEAVPSLNARYQASRRANTPFGGRPSTQDMTVTPDPIPPSAPTRKTTFSGWSKKVDGTTPPPGQFNWAQPRPSGGTTTSPLARAAQLRGTTGNAATGGGFADVWARMQAEGFGPQGGEDYGEVARAQLRAQASGAAPVQHAREAIRAAGGRAPLPAAGRIVGQAPSGLLSQAFTRLRGAAKRGLSAMKYL